MTFSKLARWMPTSLRRAGRKPARTTLALHALEAREVPATHIWTGANSNFWNDDGNWTGGKPATGEAGGTVVQLGTNTNTFQNIPNLTVDVLQFTNNGSATLTLLQPLAVDGSLAAITKNVINPAGTTNAINGTQPLTVKGTFAPFFSINGTLTMDTAITGSQDLRLNTGGGVLELNKPNTYTGNTVVDQGILRLSGPVSSNNILPNTTLKVGNDAGPAGEAVVQINADGQLSTGTSIAIASDGVFNLLGHADFVGNISMNGGQIATGGGELGLTGSLTVTGDASILANGANTAGDVFLPAGDHTIKVQSGATLTIKTQLTGPGGVVITDPTAGAAAAGTVAFENKTPNANDYAGQTWVQNGTLTLNDSAQNSAFGGQLKVGDGAGAAGSAVVKLLTFNEVPNAAKVTVAADGLFDLNNNNETIGALTISGGGQVVTNGSTLTLTGDVVVPDSTGQAIITGNVNIGGPRSVSVNKATNALVITGVVSGAGGLTVNGPGTLELDGSAPNTYTGQTAVISGTLALNHAAGAAATSNDLYISGPAGAAKVQLMQDGQLPASTAVAILSAGTLDLNGHAQTIGKLTLDAGTVTTGAAGKLTLGGDVTVLSMTSTPATITGNIDIGAGDRRFIVSNSPATADLILNGVISGGAAGNFIKEGTGRLDIQGGKNSPNTFGGKTWVKDGTLYLDDDGTNEAVSKTVEVGDGQGAAGSAVLQLGQSIEIPDAATVTVHGDGTFLLNNGTLNRNEIITALVLGDSLGGGQVVGGGMLTVDDVTVNVAPTTAVIATPLFLLSGPHVLTVADGAAANDLQIDGPVSGGGAVVKNGLGTLTLNGNNTYSGATTVNTGSLVVNGSSPASTIAVASGAFLRGSGAAGAVNANNGSTVSPGVNSTAKLSTKALTLNGATFAVELAGPLAGQFDQLDVTGAVTLTNATLATSASFVPAATQQFKIINNDGTDAVTGTFNGLPEGQTFTLNGRPFKITYVGGDGNDVALIENTPNTPPSISDVANQTTAGTAVGPVSFTVTDGETPATDLVVTAASSNPALVPNANVVVSGAGATRTVTVTPAAGQVGTTTVTLTVTDAGGLTATDTFDVVVTAPVVPPVVPPGGAAPKQFAAGADKGGAGVRFFNPDGSERFTASPFPGFTGGVRTASGDFNGDGVADLVVGTGPGAATQVRVLDGVTQAELFSVAPFESTFTGGVYVAAGDVTGDGIADLVITPDEGGGPRARVFSGAGFGIVDDFFGIDDPNFRGGARAAIGDLTGDGRGDLVVVAGFGGGPRVAAYDGASLGGAHKKVFGDFFAFEQTLRNGIYVAAGDVTGDGVADLIAGGGPGGGPRVTVFDGKELMNNNAVPVANFFGGDAANRGGIRLAVKNLDNDGKADVVVGAGTGAGSKVTGYLGKDLATGAPTATAFDFDAFGGFTGGVFVG